MIGGATMTGWQKTVWGEVCILAYGRAIKGYHEKTSGIPVFGTNGQIGWWDKPLQSTPGIVVGRKGAYRGIHYSARPFFVIDTAYALKPGLGLDPRWAYYCLLGVDINSMDSGSAIPSTNRDEFYSMPLLLPPLPEQREIASVLGALDDKIELNRKMAAVLEEMARALYRSWFVDFDPIWAKAEGRPPAHMDPATAALFPDGFDDEGLPLGWERGLVEDLFVLQRGFDLPASTRTDGPYPVFAAGGHHGTHTEYKVKGPGVTTGRSGVIGDVFLIMEDFWPLNTSLWVKEFKRGSAYFTYFFMGTLDLKSLNSGSAVPSLNRNNVHNLTADIPPTALVTAFDERVSPIFAKLAALERENQTLATLRDSLLLRLMTGELRVGAAREKMQDVA